MAIIISKGGKNAKKIEKSNFEKEDYLQKYIYDNPESIPLYDIKDDIRLLILVREFPTDSGPIDAVGIDIYGNIYLIETKLFKNPDKRTVVAQVLDYGASLWRNFSNFSNFLQIAERETNKNFGTGLNQKIKDFFDIDDDEISSLMDNVEKNLNDGKFKFVVLMDKLHDRLKDLIVFINTNSEFDIYAVEMEYYKLEDREIIIPKIFGAEVKKDIAVDSSSNRKKWDETSFLKIASETLDKESFEAVKKLYDFSKDVADSITWGTGSKRSSFNPRFLKISSKSLYTMRSNGKLSLNFGWLNDNETSEKYRDDFKEILEKEKIFDIPADYKTHFPEYEAKEWSRKTDKFIEAVEKLLKN